MKRSMKKFFLSILVFILALFIIFQEWVWDTLKPFLEYFSRFSIVQRIENWIKNLNVGTSLFLFAVPFVLTHIIELWAIGLTALGNVFLGFFIYGMTKIVGFMILSRIFTLTKPKLMTVTWFRILFDWFIEKKAYLYSKLEEMDVWQRIKKIKANAKLKYYILKWKIIGNKKSVFSRALARMKEKITNWK